MDPLNRAEHTVEYRLFLSDVHVPVLPGPSPRQDRLVSFLSSLSPSPKDLFLLGDIFEFWYEYDTVLYASYFPLLHSLARLRDLGTQIHLVTGNHDFWAGPQFESLLSATVSYDVGEGTLSGRRVFLCHGDGFAPEDNVYRIFRRVLRNPSFTWCMGRLPPGMVARLANVLAKWTRNRSHRSDEKDRKALRRLAEKKIAEGFDVFLCAHLHFPEVDEIEVGNRRGLFLNVGDWWEHDSYVLEHQGIFALHEDRKDERPWIELST